ncbi:hypothetical protein [Beihai hepe-like virus 4]|uniref:hypothetical protein n=1 Tax=Beihai hepe-like virus 4 TaxID=1922387 RepID=UPI00090998A4|nr:hypothetical protein [Beihai hepe-like virus 4]APG77597.1 hypothetical protein [Beihai hepe-like virus 4]
MDFEKYFPKPFIPGQSHRTILQYDQFKAIRSWHISSVSIASIINLIIGFTVLAALANLEIFIDVENDGVIAKLDEMKQQMSDNSDRAHLDSTDLLKQLKLMVTSLASANNKLDSILVSVNQNRDSNVASAAAAAVIESTILLVHQQLSNMLQMYGANTARDDIFHSKVLSGIDAITVNTGDSAGQATIIANLEEIKASVAASLAELTTLNGFQAVIAEEVTDVNVELVGIGASVATLVVLQQTTGIRIREHSVTIRDQPILVDVEKFFPVISTRPASGHEWPVKGTVNTIPDFQGGSVTIEGTITTSPAVDSVWTTEPRLPEVLNTSSTPSSGSAWFTNPDLGSTIVETRARPVGRNFEVEQGIAEDWTPVDWYTIPVFKSVVRVKPGDDPTWVVAPADNTLWLSNSTAKNEGPISISGPVETVPLSGSIWHTAAEPVTDTVWDTKASPTVGAQWMTKATPVPETIWSTVPDMGTSIVETRARPVGRNFAVEQGIADDWTPVDWYTVPVFKSTVKVKPGDDPVWVVSPASNTMWLSNNTASFDGPVVIDGPIETKPAVGTFWHTVADPKIDAVWSTTPNMGSTIVETRARPVGRNFEVEQGTADDWTTVDWYTVPVFKSTVRVKPGDDPVWVVSPDAGSVWLSNNTKLSDGPISISGPIETTPSNGAIWHTNVENTVVSRIETVVTVAPELGSKWEVTQGGELQVKPAPSTMWPVYPIDGTVWLSNNSETTIAGVIETKPVQGSVWHTSIDNEVDARIQSIVTVTPELGSKWEVVQSEDFYVIPAAAATWSVYPAAGTVWLSNNTLSQKTSVEGIVYTAPASDAVWVTDPSIPSIINTMPTIPSPLDVQVAGSVVTKPDLTAVGPVVVQQSPNTLWYVNINDTDGPLYTKPDLSPNVAVEVINQVSVVPVAESTWDTIIVDTVGAVATKPDLTPFVSVEVIGTVDTKPTLTETVEVEPSSSAFWLTQAVPADGWDWSVKPAVQTVWQSSPVTVVNTKPQFSEAVEVEPSSSAFWLTQAIPADGWDWSVKPAVQTVWQSSPVTVVNTKPQFSDPVPVTDSDVVAKLDSIECTVTDITLADNVSIPVRQDYINPWYVEQEPNDWWTMVQVPGHVWAVKETPAKAPTVRANKYDL